MMGGLGPAPFCGMVHAGTWRDHRCDNILDGAVHFYGVYRTADNKHVAVGAIEPQFYAELCRRLDVDVPHDDDAPSVWSAHREVLAARFLQKTRAEWEQQLGTPGSCAAPVLTITEAPSHPHHVARRTFIEVDGVPQPAPAPRFSRTVPSALPGDHTRDVLAGLGFDEGAVAELADAGAVPEHSGPYQLSIERTTGGLGLLD
jgi:alpha-methylacyl-CoA racemase